MEIIEEYWIIELEENCYFDSFERNNLDELELYDSDVFSDCNKYDNLELAQSDLEIIKKSFNYDNARVLRVQTSIEEEY